MAFSWNSAICTASASRTSSPELPRDCAEVDVLVPHRHVEPQIVDRAARDGSWSAPDAVRLAKGFASSEPSPTGFAASTVVSGTCVCRRGTRA